MCYVDCSLDMARFGIGATVGLHGCQAGSWELGAGSRELTPGDEQSSGAGGSSRQEVMGGVSATRDITRSLNKTCAGYLPPRGAHVPCTPVDREGRNEAAISRVGSGSLSTRMASAAEAKTETPR